MGCCNRNKNMYQTFIVIILSTIIIQNVAGQQQSQCTSATDCTSCMIIGPNCYWCQDQNFTSSGTLIRPRCNTLNALKPICKNMIYLNSSVTVTKISDFSSTVQVKPQMLKLDLRPGQSRSFKVSVQPAVNFPVDIYFLMDLSASMEDDLVKLQNLGKEIAKSIGNITKNYRLGFGAFIDKALAPMVPLTPTNFPCHSIKERCRPVFGYVHVFNFSNNATEFSAALGSQKISGDVDKPEGSFDGLMQLAVCGEQVNWKPKGTSRRIAMVVTDALPKTAGDAKIAGIIKPNDRKCYMKSRIVAGNIAEKYFYKSEEMDYPSIHQLRNSMLENSITPILAVTDDVLPIYQKIATEWADLGGAADVLSNNSDNIVKLVRDNYNRISTTVKLTDDSPSYLQVDYKVDASTCSHIDSSSQCSKVKLNHTVVFDVTATLISCPNPMPKDSKLKVKIASFGEVEIDLNYLCNCDCSRIANSPFCHSNGTYECGICICNSGRFGHLCQCDSSQPSQNDTSTCLDPLSTDKETLCNGFGQCICGKCECFSQSSPRIISGEYCECNNFGCPKHNGKECGGAERGSCKCAKCQCNKPYEGSNCGITNCDVVKSTRCSNKDGIVCSDNGVCDCISHQCRCKIGFTGEFCELCIAHDCKCAVVDQCVNCAIRNITCDAKFNCSMHEYILTNDTIENACRSDINNCVIQFNITGDPTRRNESVTLLYSNKTVCSGQPLSDGNDNPDLLAIILGIIAGILLLGLLLLLLWKLLVTLHDKREYAKFEKSKSDDSQWEKDGNPIYKEPNQQFVNPAFAGDM